VAGRALVLHAADGSRVGCGLVEPTSGQFVSFSSYPGYAGVYDDPVGTLLVTDLGGSAIMVEGAVAGLEATATGGLHIHEGFNCDDARGHYFQAGEDDPWLDTTYTTDAEGVDSNVSLVVSPYTLHHEYPVAHRSVVLHESDGTRVACGVLGAAAEATAPPETTTEDTPQRGKAVIKAKVTLGSYPGTSTGVEGFLRIDAEEDEEKLTITGTVTGLEPSVAGAGIHIHTGFSCEDASLVFGHYFEDGTVDPWLATTYDTDENGVASISLEVSDGGFSMAGRLPVAGRALVLHAADGSRVACGLVEPTSGEFVSFDFYPGYVGDATPVGTVLVEDRGSSSIHLEGLMAGLEATVTGGIHIHEGFNCDNAGGHYFQAGEDDPWLDTTYSTNADGVVSSLNHLTVAPYSLRREYPVAYRAVVLHEADGTRVACGVLGAGPDLIQASSEGTSQPTPRPTMVPTDEPTTGGPPPIAGPVGVTEINNTTKKKGSSAGAAVIVIVAAVCVVLGLCAGYLFVNLVHFVGRKEKDGFKGGPPASDSGHNSPSTGSELELPMYDEAK